MNWREIITRATLTFVQTFLAMLLVDGLTGIDDIGDLKAPLVAAVAAVLSMAYRIVREYQASKGWDNEE